MKYPVHDETLSHLSAGIRFMHQWHLLRGYVSNEPCVRLIDSRWCLYGCPWKSLWATSAAVSGANVTEIQRRLENRPDRYRFGYLSDTPKHASRS